MSEHLHEHHHDHEHRSHSPEETLALLNYMIDHNKHHAEELHELAHSTGDEAAKLIHEAVVQFNAGNALLEKALVLLKEE